MVLLKYIYCQRNPRTYSLLKELESKSIFSHKTGGRGHWRFIIESEFIPEDLDFIVNQECNLEEFCKFIKKYYSDSFYITDDIKLTIFVKESKMGWIIGKQGWKIKKLKSFFGEINLIPVKFPSKIHWWWGYGRNNMILEKSLCNGCNKKLNDTIQLNEHFYKCNRCNSINVIK